MENHNWSGFDPRKICPRCGGYQTRVSISKRSPSTPKQPIWGILLTLFAFLPLVFGFVVVSTGQVAVPEPYLLAAFLLACIVMVSVSLYRRNAIPAIRKLFESARRYFDFSGEENAPSYDEGNPANQPEFYFLRCSNCGYRWQKTSDEWENELQNEARDATHSPMPLGSVVMMEDFEKIEWKPPDPKRGAFLVISTLFLFIITVTALYGVFRSITHPGSSSLYVGITIGAYFILWFSIGLMFKFKLRLLKIIPILLFLLLLLGIKFFRK